MNQVATNALMARLEAQRAISDASENELHRKYKQRDEIQKQIRPDWEQARKRSRMDDALLEERDSRTILHLPRIKPRTPVHKELRVFLEEEQRASEAGSSFNEERKQKEIEEGVKAAAETNITIEKPEEHNRSIVALEAENPLEDQLQKLDNIQFPLPREPETEEDEESRKQRGKGNVEKWLQMLLENTEEELETQNSKEDEERRIDGIIIRKQNPKYLQKEKRSSITEENSGVKEREDITEMEARNIQTEERRRAGEVGRMGERVGSSSFEGGRERRAHSNGKERKLVRSESARGFRRIPSSPALILGGMKKGVDCIGKKPIVNGDEDSDGDRTAGNNSFIKSSIRTIKKAVKI